MPSQITKVKTAIYSSTHPNAGCSRLSSKPSFQYMTFEIASVAYGRLDVSHHWSIDHKTVIRRRFSPLVIPFPIQLMTL